MQKVERERLLLGNWNIRESAGEFFQRDWFEVVDVAPSSMERIVRYWDRAGTAAPKGEEVRASWTAGVKMGQARNGLWYILDVVRFQGSPKTVMERIKNVATQDGLAVMVGIEQDPGQAGKAEAAAQVENLAGFNARINTVRESKALRASPLSAQVEAGNVKLVRGRWNDPFLTECENFDGSDRSTNDQVDAASGGFFLLRGREAGVWGS